MLMMLIVFPKISYASSYRVESLKYNKWYKLKDSSTDMTIYKFRIKADTVLMFQWKNYTSKGSFAYGSIYYDKECGNEVKRDFYLFLEDESIGNTGIALYPGTYYIRMYDEAEKAQVKVTSKPVKKVNKTNYCLDKVITLKPNKTVEIAQTKRNHYPRWYKIKLKKSQYIQIMGDIREYYDLYDSNFNEIRCNDSKERVITDGVQPAGTYYLVIYDYISGLMKCGEYYSFYLK